MWHEPNQNFVHIMTIFTEIQGLMQNQREALGRLAKKLAGEAQEEVQQPLKQHEVCHKIICK